MSEGQRFEFMPLSQWRERQVNRQFKRKTMSNTKKILFIDMDGVVADFDKAVRKIDPTLSTLEGASFEQRAARVDAICEANNRIFLDLDTVPSAIESVLELAKEYDIYFLSTPMWNVPQSFTDKRLWIERHFGAIGHKRLILSHRKDLCVGDYLIDDRLRHGVENFQGEHIHFGQDPFFEWQDVLDYLLPSK